jgi:hypothetical protein
MRDTLSCLPDDHSSDAGDIAGGVPVRENGGILPFPFMAPQAFPMPDAEPWEISPTIG